MISTFKRPLNIAGAWKNLSRKVFSCPQCAQKIRVPVRPGKVLRVHCQSCRCHFQLDFKVPLIEFFRWQSGKSLKHNLLDLKNRFWNLSFRSKVGLLSALVLMSLMMSLLFTGLGGKGQELDNQKAHSENPPATRRI